MEALQIGHYSSSKLDDSTVIKRVIAGEKELFEILMRRYNQTLYRVVRSYIKNEEEINDLMQNTYLKAFDKLYQFNGNSSFSTWLIRIGINESLLKLQRTKKDNLIYLNSMETNSDALNQIPDKQMNAEKAIIRQEITQILEQVIDRLPEKYKVIYMLKEVEGLTNQQVSETLHISDTNIKVRLHRAKTMLKEDLYNLSSSSGIFEFGNSRCDAIVNSVMKSI